MFLSRGANQVAEVENMAALQPFILGVSENAPSGNFGKFRYSEADSGAF